MNIHTFEEAFSEMERAFRKRGLTPPKAVRLDAETTDNLKQCLIENYGLANGRLVPVEPTLRGVKILTPVTP